MLLERFSQRPDKADVRMVVIRLGKLELPTATTPSRSGISAFGYDIDGPVVEVPEFSVVVGVAERDAYLVPKTLPSWLALGSSEVILCVDKPASRNLLEAIRQAAAGDGRVRVVEVPQDPEWLFRLALVRRTGFKNAKHDVIFTGDIDDIVVAKVCLKAVAMVGKRNVGLVSLSKRRGGGTWAESVRNLGRVLVRVTTGKTHFTGLYALYRPYWEDSEVEEDVKKAPHPESATLLEGRDPYRGEDAILRDHMLRTHKVLYLPDVGGTDLRVSLNDRPVGQSKLGVKYAREGRPFEYVLPRCILNARGITIGVYARLLAQQRGGWYVVAQYGKMFTSIVSIGMQFILRRLGLPVKRPVV